MNRLLNFFFFILLPAQLLAADWIDRSHSVFLPKSLNAHLSIQTDFPTFWWNFVIIEPSSPTPSFAIADEFCHKILNLPQFINKSACPDITSLAPLVQSWSADVFRRQPAPPVSDLKNQFAVAKTKASLPLDRSLLNILRIDPLETTSSLQNLLLGKMSFGFEKEKGYFVDPKTKRIVLPIQMKFPANETTTTRQLLKGLDLSPSLAIVGPHISTLENENAVFRSLDRTTLLGVALLLMQIAFVIIKKRWSYFLLIPPMLGGVSGALVFTIFIYGSIHGLTLSLGIGLIALALDYGLHSAHNIRWAGVWRANLFGLLTTFAGLLAISLSQIPLLQQMMIFSSAGLFLSYVFYYLFHKKFPKQTFIAPFRILPRTNTIKTFFAIGLSTFGLCCSFLLKPDLNMHQFDAQSPETLQRLVWLYSHIHQRMPLFSIQSTNKEMFAIADKQKAWANENQIVLQQFADFLPAPEKQIQNLQSWKDLCPINFFQSDEKILFQPFLQQWPCEKQHALDVSNPPLYLSDAMNSTRWLTSWYPKNDSEIQAIQKFEPSALSLREILQKFPQILQNELNWMIPLSVFICLLLLATYFKNWLKCTISLLPFFCGLGTYFLAVVLLGWHFSFISIIALIMVFGLSIDYGIFAANLYLLKDPPPAEGVWSCLATSALVTILGFLPLAICEHPVLKHLGQTLILGSLGTWIGTFWGIPGVFAWQKGRSLP